ncbi:hypothetical protein [Streptomyces atrovirens]
MGFLPAALPLTLAFTLFQRFWRGGPTADAAKCPARTRSCPPP